MFSPIHESFGTTTINFMSLCVVFNLSLSTPPTDCETTPPFPLACDKCLNNYVEFMNTSRCKWNGLNGASFIDDERVASNWNKLILMNSGQRNEKNRILKAWGYRDYIVEPESKFFWYQEDSKVYSIRNRCKLFTQRKFLVWTLKLEFCLDLPFQTVPR